MHQFSYIELLKNNYNIKSYGATEWKATIQKLRKKTTLVRTFNINLLVPVLHFMVQKLHTFRRNE